MNRLRMAMFGGVLVAAVTVVVAGVAARSNDGGGSGAPTAAERGAQDRGGSVERGDRRERIVVAPGDRRVIRLDGRGRQLGVMVSDGDDASKPGVRIDGVDEGSAAAKAGAQEGDVVVEFDGERVRSARQLTRLVKETPSGRAVKMTVLRNGAKQTLDVTPEEAPSAFTWNSRGGDFQADLRDDIGRDIEREIQRGMRGRGLNPPTFDFRFDGIPGIPALGGRGRLGVQVESLSDQLAGYFGATTGGVLVSSVTKESPAEKAGLKAGDVITTVNGTAVREAGELVEELSEVKDGAEVSIGILRDKRASTVKATLEAPRGSRARRSTRPA